MRLLTRRPQSRTPAPSAVLGEVTAWGDAVHGPHAGSHAGSQPITSQGHLASLDGVRGVAILLVMLFHFFATAQPQSLVGRLAVALTGNGWVGVDLFLVLSGFLITGILLDTRLHPHYYRHFYARRSLRIFPLYFAFLAILFLALPLLVPVIGEKAAASLRADQAWLWTHSVNILAAIRGGWESTPLVGHFWSLSVEEHFYLLWPFVVRWCSARTLARVCIGIVVSAPLLRLALFSLTGDGFAGNVLTPTRADTLAAGAWLAIAARQPGGLSALRRSAPKIAAGALLVLATLFVIRHPLQGIDVRVQAIGFTALSALSVALLALLLERPLPLLQRAMTWTPLTVLGGYSYAMYVLHQPVHVILHGIGIGPASIGAAVGTALGGALIFASVAGAVTLALATVSWYCLESPMLSLKRFFPR